MLFNFCCILRCLSDYRTSSSPWKASALLQKTQEENWDVNPNVNFLNICAKHVLFVWHVGFLVSFFFIYNIKHLFSVEAKLSYLLNIVKPSVWRMIQKCHGILKETCFRLQLTLDLLHNAVSQTWFRMLFLLLSLTRPPVCQMSNEREDAASSFL